ncbi:MAG: AAA family ATPase [Parcubacteria group bacterium]
MAKIIIGLVGESGSGKDTVAKYLNEKYGAKLMRFADPIKETLNIYFEQSSREDQQWMYLKLKERFGGDVLGRAIRKRVENADGIIAINGLRMPDDLVFMRSFEKSYIIYITANQKLRWERTAGRGEKADDDITFEKFQEMERVETEVHIPEIGAKADFKIVNEKDLEFLLKSADEIMAKIQE